MIIYPESWQGIGLPVTINDIDRVLRNVISSLPCVNLSYSGGIDSSLLLHYMLESGKMVHTFTVTSHQNHPDNEYSARGIEYYKSKYGNHRIHSKWLVIPNAGNGNSLVLEFYRALDYQKVPDIIAGDGIDEYMCGYYKHQADPSESCYYGLIRRLQAEHLKPLNENSGKIKVYLPYLDPKLVFLYGQIPLCDKVGDACRKIFIVELAKGKVPVEIIERKKYGFATIP